MQSIRKLLKQASVQSDREKDHFAKKYGVTGAQMGVLDFIADQPQQTASQHSIEQEFNLRRSTVTIMVQRMERQGLISRLPSRTDKRQKVVALTVKGRKLVPVIKDSMARDDGQIAAHFSPAELQAVIKALTYIKNGEEHG